MKSKDGAARRTISPCLLVESLEDEAAFLKAVFDVTFQDEAKRGRTLWSLEAQLGDTTLKIGRANGDELQTRSVLYVWTDDVDGTCARALAAGATLISEPTDQPWGVREAGFRAPQGNVWWIGRRMRKMSNREVEENLRKQRQARL